jgi:hypothetical protein
MAEDRNVKMGAWVPEGFRVHFRMFCLSRRVDMQDVLRVMVEKLLQEGESNQPSRFVKEVLEKAAAAPTEKKGADILTLSQPR